MNTRNLEKLYDRLTARERLTLLISASVRADPVERQRLVDSAPREHHAIPHHHSLARALAEAATIHLLTLLEVAASYWQWWGLWNWHELSRHRQKVSKQERQRDERRWQLLRMVSYRFVVCADGWRLLCTQMHIDPVVLLKDLPGYDAVQQMEQAARLFAFSAEEALAFLRADGEASRPAEEKTDAVRREYKIDTADDVAQSMRAFLQMQLDEWR